MADFITVTAPDGEQWCDQEYFISRSVITGLRLVKYLGKFTADNGVEVHTSDQKSCRYFMRCPDYESAVKLYSDIKSQL